MAETEQCNAEEPAVAIDEPAPAEVLRFAGNRAKPPKSQGQAILERLLAARDRLGKAQDGLEEAMTAIRGRRDEPEPGGHVLQQGGERREFFSALERLTEEFERITSEVERDVADLRARF